LNGKVVTGDLHFKKIDYVIFIKSNSLFEPSNFSFEYLGFAFRVKTYLSLKRIVILMNSVSTPVTLEMIFQEVKKVNDRLILIENAVEEVIISNLPEVTVSKKEAKEIEEAIQEMKHGKYVTLEELKGA
jgi:hypothetical protein